MLCDWMDVGGCNFGAVRLSIGCPRMGIGGSGYIFTRDRGAADFIYHPTVRMEC